MKPCSRSPEHSRPKIWRNSEDSVAAFGHDEGRSPAGFASSQADKSLSVMGHSRRFDISAACPPSLHLGPEVDIANTGIDVIQALQIGASNHEI
jgi:hypothetical protein